MDRDEAWDAVDMVWWLLALIYMLALRMTPRGTLGYRIVRIRYAHVLSDRPGWTTLAYRSAIALLLLWIFALDHFWILFSRHKQAWHDKVAGFYVVRTDAQPIGTRRVVRRVINFMMLTWVVWELEDDGRIPFRVAILKKAGLTAHGSAALRPAGRTSVARVFKPWKQTPSGSRPAGRTESAPMPPLFGGLFVAPRRPDRRSLRSARSPSGRGGRGGYPGFENPGNVHLPYRARTGNKRFSDSPHDMVSSISSPKRRPTKLATPIGMHPEPPLPSCWTCCVGTSRS